MDATPVELRPVAELAGPAREVVTAFEHDLADVLAGIEVHHIGATALPSGRTKGDVDVNVRVEEARFPDLVAALRERLEIAQPQNWTPSFASFSAPGYALPLGVQVTVVGSPDDFLLRLRDRLRADPDLLRRYDEVKAGAAAGGAEAYWQAKDRFLRALLG